jgi:L-2-hydroxyglutarate oxidase LhgO
MGKLFSKIAVQLRPAQQAYRYRKETATLSLQHRLEHLQTQIQNLHRTFQAYNHQLERSGILSFDPALEGNLQRLRTQFLAFSAAANSSNEGSSAIQMNEIASTMTQGKKQRKHTT